MPQTVPAININGVQCSFAMPGGRLSISESSGEDGPRTTLLLQCLWVDRWNLVRALRGTCTLDGGGGFSRTAPYRLPSNQNLVCTAVGEFEYIGSGAQDDGSVFAPLAKLPAFFSCVPWQFEDGDPAGQNDASGHAWTVTRIKPSTEVYQPTGGTYFVGPFPSTTPLDEASIGFLRANVEIQETRKFLPRMPLAAIQAAEGTINLDPVTYADQEYAEGQLLLVACETEPYFDCVGNPVMDLNLTFLGRTGDATWNQVQDRTGSFEDVNTKADGTGNFPFDETDYDDIPR